MVDLYLRAAAFAVALFAVYVFATPVYVGAQQSTTAQQVEIGELQRRAGENDALVQKLETQESANASAISEIQGEARVFFSVLSVLTGGSFLGQVVVQRSTAIRRRQENA